MIKSYGATKTCKLSQSRRHEYLFEKGREDVIFCARIDLPVLVLLYLLSYCGLVHIYHSLYIEEGTAFDTKHSLANCYHLFLSI